jgi:hypothetical protein
MLDPHTLLLLAALAAPNEPAAPAPSANDSVLASVIAPLVPQGARVRVRTGFGVTDGVAGAVSPVGLEMRCDRGEGWSQPCGKPLAWSQIERIDLHSRHPGQGAKIGATVGGLVGIAFALSVAAYASAVSESGTGYGGVLFAGIVGGIAGGCVGGLAGGVIDAATPSWKTVFERR